MKLFSSQAAYDDPMEMNRVKPSQETWEKQLLTSYASLVPSKGSIPEILTLVSHF